MIDREIEYNARQRLYRHINTWHTDAYIPMISEWASENRYLPPGTTEFPGMIDHSIAPYLVEIQDAAHPLSGVKSITIMKATQTGATTAVENVIGHAIKYKLHNILYVISSKSMAKMRSSAAIDVMIDNSNLAECMRPISTRIKRKVADSTWYKEAHGNRRIALTSYGSIADAKSFSWSLVILDELEEAGSGELKKQGDVEKIFQGRTKTIRDFKIIKISTPTHSHGRINLNFMDGDRRYFFCQCPFCGELQVLTVYGISGADYGLRARTEKIDGIEQVIPNSVHYICKFCRREIYEYQKQAMLTGGKWVPTARPVNPEYRSYHISNLMSPIMFYTWKQCMQEYAETEWGLNIMKYKNYLIDVLGQPWETKAEKKDWRELMARSEEYKKGEIPTGGLILTGGADVQKNRIELCVTAWGRDMESFVIDYQVFFGETSQRVGGVWAVFENFLRTKRYKLKDITIPIALTAVDSGYNPARELTRNEINAEHTVYEFVARNHTRTIAVRGNPDLKDMVLKEERVKRQSPLKRRYECAVNELKDEIYVNIDLPAGSPKYMHFTHAHT